MANLVETRELTRRFGDVTAVDHVSFTVGPGEVFGLLGPNGAGKTTTVRMLTGYLPPTGGTVVVAGHDLSREPTEARQHAAVVPEEANVYVDLTIWQNLMLMAELHGVPRQVWAERGRKLLATFDLADRTGAKGRHLSKGLRQRLMLCMALVTEPSILFLDEPTSGLDVQSARLIRDLVAGLPKRGMAVFLTTHNMDEATQLCDRVAILNRGKLVAIDTPAALRARVASRAAVEITFAGPGLVADELSGLGVEAEIQPIPAGLRLTTSDPGRVAQEVCGRATAKGIRVASVNTLAPTLEDVFVQLTESAGGPPEGERP
ncbi:MAG: ABC transporter ATP-binding protein [Armatimonadetes bacterium CG_4_10_14_3_um_filter_66_18]|nr:ABC transporter ATP-binding protein [Armatimonadota bacterium]OIO95956.1 MAG: ABC transporter ATP-binding protein [Armatimonadetes bacterium CG2_30_66_41]PIU92339.1 MAG: ABC transporter ATP-binding protein [Armatimonadetes bacterium CG06_land_8_20_14_3_00_66_21]PIX46520.1 MAG: ABC transporter ATP-binding protein [Armatimonadetes bacterium CG_4_8_14_3_um_filter_66_20]PIY50705.1 MAG: ABC transporter ATP-binding protein [Armatimonadetes bacterium CG_4_10_14_3_um_filter_66_18]PIZ43991.1 MAG: AB